MCDEREQLIGYVYDECSASERREVEAHLATCDECRHEIRALRSVRQDLLAWSVPEHESVWRPLPVAAVQPFWRTMPAWAMAAAAGVILLAGAAGGATAYAFLPRPAAPVAAALAVPPPPTAVPQMDWSAVEARMLTQLQRELDQRVRESAARQTSDAGSTRTAGSAVSSDDLARQLTALRAQQEQLIETVYGVYSEQAQMKIGQNRNNMMLVSLMQDQVGR